MSSTQFFLDALSKGWLLDRSYVDARLPLIGNLVKGKPVDFGVRNPNPGKVSALNFSAGVTLAQPSWFDGFDRAPEGSYAVITIRGPVMHYGWCNDGTAELADLVRQAEGSSKIKGIFFDVDTPGGQVDGTAALADVIKSASKPSLAFVRGMAASAGMWIISAVDETYAANDLVSVGSVGVYTTIYDYREYFKSLKIKIEDIYAPQSTDKNKNVRDALDGKVDAIKAELKIIADKFIQTVESNLNGQLTSEDWKTGKLYFAPQAKTIGLITGIKNYEQALARLDEMAKKPSSTSNKNSNKKAMNEFENLSALSEVEDPTDEQIDSANADLTKAGITKVTLVKEDFITESANVTTERNTLKDANVKLTSDLAAANTAKDALATENATLKEKIAKRPGADISGKLGSEESNADKTEEQQLDEELAGLPHNASVMNNPLFN